MKRRIIISVCLVCLLLVGFGTQPRPVAAAGNTYYVAKTGNDSNPGTLAQPFLTIQRGVNRLVAGDTLYVGTGTYNERLDIDNIVGTGAYTTISNYNGESVVIDGTNVSSRRLIDIYYCSYITINGFEIRNSTTAGLNATYGDNHITLKNLYIHDCGSSGISAGNQGAVSSNFTIDNCETYNTNTSLGDESFSLIQLNNFEIKNCKVHDTYSNGSQQQVGIDCKQGCTNGSIHDNTIYNCGANIYIDSYGVTTSNISIYDNIIYNASGVGITLGCEVSPASVTGINIYNNILYSNRRGFMTYGEAGGFTTLTFTFINNTLYQNADSGLTEVFLADTQSYTNCVIRNNIIVGKSATTFLIVNKTSGGVTIDHNLFYDKAGYDTDTYGTNYVIANPLLMNPTSDFSIPGNSPAVDAGSAVNAPSTDYIGTSRFQGAGYDIGAYEYQIVSGLPPATTVNVIIVTSPALLPTASVSYRGVMAMVQGGNGVTDALYQCMKSAANTYSWVLIATGG